MVEPMPSAKPGSRWSADDVPSLAGCVAIVTGANSGIGLEAARVLAARGAHVVLACRDTAKAESARATLVAASPKASLEVLPLDLASLASIRGFAAAVGERHPAVHLVVNNAGVMAIPRRETADGFEMQLGTNHLGHFALTGLLLGRVLAAPGARIVTVSSTMHRPGRMRWDDLHGVHRYGPWRAYAQSKLANLLFAFELGRRLEAAGAGATSVACHPGYAATQLQAVGPRMSGSRLLERATDLANVLFAQSAAMGALPTLYAAVAPGLSNGDYVGPGGLAELSGHPRLVRASARARDAAAAARLWEVSAELTGVGFEALAQAR